MRAAPVLALLLVPAACAFPVDVEDDAIQRALDWLRERTREDGCVAVDLKSSCTHGTTRDAVVAISAAGADPRAWSTPSPVDFLRSHRAQLEAEESGCPACLWAKTIVALEASGEEPRAFGDFDYVERLDGFFDGVQMGHPRQINDDAWALYAYMGLDERDEGIVDALRLHLEARQNPGDGGWSWNLGMSEAWGTATMVLALLESGTPASDGSIDRGLDFLETQLGPNGLLVQEGADSAESTAVAIQAIRRAAEDPTAERWTRDGRDLVGALLSLQASDGSFAHNAAGGSRFVATTQVLPALRGVPYPFRPPTVELVAEPATARAGEEVRVRAVARDVDGPMASFAWALDGERVEGGESLVARLDPGSHEVRVVAVDADGVARSASKVLQVAAPSTGYAATLVSDPPVADAGPITPLSRPSTTPGPTALALVAVLGVVALVGRRFA